MQLLRVCQKILSVKRSEAGWVSWVVSVGDEAVVWNDHSAKSRTHLKRRLRFSAVGSAVGRGEIDLGDRVPGTRSS